MTINLDQWMWTSWQSLEKQSRHLAALTFLPITQIIIMIIIIWVIIIADYHTDDDSCSHGSHGVKFSRLLGVTLTKSDKTWSFSWFICAWSVFNKRSHMTKVSKPVWMYQGQAQLLRSKSPMKSSIDTTPNTFVLNFNHIEKNHPHRNRMETWSPEQTSDREVRGWSSYLQKRNENNSKTMFSLSYQGSAHQAAVISVLELVCDLFSEIPVCSPW